MGFYLKWQQLVYQGSLLLLLIAPHQTIAGECIDFKELIAETFPNTHVGIDVLNLKTMTPVLDINAHTPFTPASVMKILTAAFTLKVLGPHYQYKTKLYQNGEDYYLAFSNDPTLLYTSLLKLFTVLKNKTIRGNLYIITNNKGFPPYHPKSHQEDAHWCYGTPIDGAIIDGNAVEFMMKHDNNNNETLLFEPLKNNLGFRIINEAKSCTCDESKPFSCELDREDQKNSIRIYGCYDKRHPNKKVCFPVTNTQDKIHAVLAKLFKELHINIKGEIAFSASIPKATKLLNTVYSKPVKDMLVEVLSLSDNLVAQSLFITALKKERPDFYKWEQVDTLLKEVLPKYFELQDIDSSVFHDGNGVSSTQSVTPAFISHLLKRASQDKDLYKIFKQTLSQPGKKGTYKKRLLQLKDHLWVKTGTMDHVTTLAGYMDTARGTPLAFTIFINHMPPSLRKEKWQRLDQIVKALYDNF